MPDTPLCDQRMSCGEPDAWERASPVRRAGASKPPRASVAPAARPRPYFQVASGGLKLREERPGRPHLIQFERANEPQQRESRYRITEVNDGTVLSAALADAIGIRVVVTKHRRLFLWREVRIHLDRVEQLGEFIELEAVAPSDSDLVHEHDLVVELRAAFGITDEASSRRRLRRAVVAPAFGMNQNWFHATSTFTGQMTEFAMKQASCARS